MAKDPFASVPPLPPELVEEELAPHGDHQDAPNGEIKQSGTPKNLFKNAQKWGLFLLAGGLLVWAAIPDPRLQNRKVKEAAPIQVDPSQLATESTSLMNSLKEQAKKEPPPAPAEHSAEHSPVIAPGGISPVVQGAQPNGPIPSKYPGAPNGQPQSGGTWIPPAGHDPEVASAKAKRDEEVRAAPIEVQGTIKLRPPASGSATPSTPKLTDLQEQLAEVESRREKAGQAQTLLANQMMSNMNQQPAPVKKRGPNEEFLAQQGEEGQRVLELQAPVAQIMLQENTAIRAVLLSDISSDLPGKISAMVTSDVYDSIYRRHIVIPKGSTLIGVYSSQVVIGQECLLVAMTRLILPNGNWISLGGAPASNLIGRSGLDADVNNHFWKMFSTSFVLGATSLMLPKSQNTVSTTATGGGSVTTGSAAALALNDALNNMMQRNKSIAPTLTTKSGMEFMFMVSQDMAMAPYKR